MKIAWHQADWSKPNWKIAMILGTTPNTVAAKRKALGKKPVPYERTFNRERIVPSRSKMDMRNDHMSF